MAFEASTHLRHLAEQALKWKHKVDNIKEKSEETIGQVKQTIEVGGTSFLLGYARGRYSDKDHPFEVAGVPYDLGIAVIGHVVGFTGMAGKYEEDVHNVSDGALALWTGLRGMAAGMDAKDKAAQPAAGAAPRQLDPGAVPQNQAELDRRMAAQVR